jgi:hypothetical protein
MSDRLYIILYRDNVDGCVRAVMDESQELRLFETEGECEDHVEADVWLNDRPNMIVDVSEIEYEKASTI